MFTATVSFFCKTFRIFYKIFSCIPLDTLSFDFCAHYKSHLSSSFHLLLLTFAFQLVQKKNKRFYFGQMPYLVERLSASDIVVEYDFDTEELSFQMDVTIGRGDPSDRCPEGFLLHSSGTYCKGEYG